jgi:hypothetical protein
MGQKGRRAVALSQVQSAYELVRRRMRQMWRTEIQAGVSVDLTRIIHE